MLFPFVSYILSRREAIKNIIPVYDNRPNLRFYQKEFFLLPDYFPRIEFESTILKHIESVNNGLNEGLKLNQTKLGNVNSSFDTAWTISNGSSYSSPNGNLPQKNSYIHIAIDHISTSNEYPSPFVISGAI